MKKSHSTELVRPDQVTVDPSIQRPLDAARVTGIASNFREEAVGHPLISHREDGTKVVLDGRHRISVLLRKGLGEIPREMIVHRGLTRAEEAELFRLHNDSKSLTPQVKFLISLIEGSPEAKAADDVLKLTGWTSEIGRKNTWRAVVALVAAVRRDRVSAQKALLVINNAWTLHTRNSNADVFKGLSNMIFRYGEAVNVEQLAQRLAKEGNLPHFQGRYRTNAATRSISAADSVADVAVGLYNYGRPKAAWLDAWTPGLS